MYIGRRGRCDDGAANHRGQCLQRPVSQLVDRPIPGTDAASHKTAVVIRRQKPRPSAGAAIGPSAAYRSENVIAAATTIAVGARRENVVAAAAAVPEPAGNVVA